MANTLHNPSELFPRYANYSHAVEVRGGSRLLFISGLNGYLADGKTMPLTFDEQAEVRMRTRHLGEHSVALTVICCQLLDPKWKLELEAVAGG
ncbi:MAG: hypothetical protein ABI821_01230 [Pseudomonadota bacterium]